MVRPTGTQTRTFTYNAQQRLHTVTNPENGTVTYTYNADGTLATKTDAKGIRSDYTYTMFQQLQSECKFQGTTPLGCQNYTWGNGTSYSAGRLGTLSYGAAGGGITETFGYTQSGRLAYKSMRFQRSGIDTTVAGSFGHNEDGQLGSVTYPGGATYSMQFDSMGRPNRMTESGGTVWVKDVLYNHAGQMMELWERQVDDSVSSQPFARTVWTYNALQQLTRITTTPVVLQPGAQDIEYRYSATQNDGKIEQMKNWVTGEEVTYQYDALERLISASTTGPEWGLSYTYDGFGNRLTQSVTKGTAPTSSLNYNAATNRITNAGYGYDANGNMTQLPGVPMPMVYDGWNRLSAVGSYTNGQGQIVPLEEYSYSPDSRRVYKKTQGSELFFFWMGGRLMSTLALGQGSTGGPWNLYSNGNFVYFAGRRLKVMGTDRLGSDISGTKYFPYGEESITTTHNRFKFATYYRDGATGLDYANHRYYSSGTGRFLTPDLLELPLRTDSGNRWNKYAYVEGDPINAFDPEGLAPLCIYRERPGREPEYGPCPWVVPVTPMPPAPIPPETCAEALGLSLSQDAEAAVAVVLGENSYPYIGQREYTSEDDELSRGGGSGPVITEETVARESTAIVEVMINRYLAAPGSTISKIAAAPGQFHGYGEGRVLFMGISGGLATNPQCERLKLAVGVVLSSLSYGGQGLGPDYRYFVAVVQPGRNRPRPQTHPTDIRIARTDFLTYPGGSPP